MTGANPFSWIAGTNEGRERGAGHWDRDRVWDLVSTYGPDVTALCQAGTALISGVDGLGLSAGSVGTVPAVRFFSDTISSRLESAQLTLNEGPCRDATASGEPVWAANLAAGSWRQRWPWFTRAALDAGARAVFALPLHAGGTRHDGAVDLYRPIPGPLNSADRLAATTFTAAVAELLTLESHGLHLTEAFAQGWRDPRSTDVGSFIAPTATPPGEDGVLLARWFGPAMLGPVRDQIRALTIDQRLHSDHAHRFMLAVHEAMANVVRHAGGHGQLLLWRRDRHLWCEVSDHGPGMSSLETSGAGRASAGPGPYGLQIIRLACTSVAITTSATGTRLLLSLDLSSRA